MYKLLHHCFQDGSEVDKIHGFHPTDLKTLIMKHTTTGAPKPAETETVEELNSRLKRLINTSRVTLFMKGDRYQPKCGKLGFFLLILKNP